MHIELYEGFLTQDGTNNLIPTFTTPPIYVPFSGFVWDNNFGDGTITCHQMK